MKVPSNLLFQFPPNMGSSMYWPRWSEAIDLIPVATEKQINVDKAIELSECPCDPRRKQERAEQQMVIC